MSYSRLNAYVSTEVMAKIDELRARLRREGASVSYSALVEIALAELLASRDPASILRKHGAKARRD
jgi:hypothetical protein